MHLRLVKLHLPVGASSSSLDPEGNWVSQVKWLHSDARFDVVIHQNLTQLNLTCNIYAQLGHGNRCRIIPKLSFLSRLCLS
jgi:hypothetical protein